MTSGGGGVRPTDPITSHLAAASLPGDALSHLQEIICEELRKARTGLIAHEIADNCGIGYQTITPRMKRLRLKGLVYNTGLVRSWHGGPGSPATKRPNIVWQLTALSRVTLVSPLHGVAREEWKAARKAGKEKKPE